MQAEKHLISSNITVNLKKYIFDINNCTVAVFYKLNICLDYTDSQKKESTTLLNTSVIHFFTKQLSQSNLI